MRSRILLCVLAAVVAGGCSPAAGRPTDAAPPAVDGAPPSEPSAIQPSDGFDVARLELRPPAGSDASPRQLDVWVADTAALRSRGLMGREELARGTGMLFEFDGETTARFWMRDTLVALSIAFVDGDGEIIDVLDMRPCTTETCARYGPDEPYHRAIEVPLGWFDEVGVEQGWTVGEPRSAHATRTGVT